MKHSVVIPLFNKAAYIGETIASLALQHRPPYEIIVVDDASTDDSLRQLHRALDRHAAALAGTRIEIITLQDNRGPAHARNQGIEIARGDLISFLDADDTYRPDCLGRIAAHARAHDVRMMVLGYESVPVGEHFPDASRLDGMLHPLDHDLLWLQEPLLTVSGAYFFMGRASNVVVSRDLLGTHRYDAASQLNEGIDLWYRVVKDLVVDARARLGLVTAPMIRFRILGDSLSHRPLSDWRALVPPPSIVRYLASDDPHDRRLCSTLARRWLEHAMDSLSDPAQKRQFIAANGAVWRQLAVAVPALVLEVP